MGRDMNQGLYSIIYPARDPEAVGRPLREMSRGPYPDVATTLVQPTPAPVAAAVV